MSPAPDGITLLRAFEDHLTGAHSAIINIFRRNESILSKLPISDWVDFESRIRKIEDTQIRVASKLELIDKQIKALGSAFLELKSGIEQLQSKAITFSQENPE